jgi:hypothetical protein
MSKLAKLQAGMTSEFPVEVAGITVNVTWKSGMFTGAYIDSLSQITISQMLSDLIETWDLTEDVPVDPDDESKGMKEVMFPTDVASLERLPIQFLNLIGSKIRMDYVPNSLRLTDSDSTYVQ